MVSIRMHHYASLIQIIVQQASLESVHKSLAVGRNGSNFLLEVQFAAVDPGSQLTELGLHGAASVREA